LFFKDCCSEVDLVGRVGFGGVGVGVLGSWFLVGGVGFIF